MVCQSWLWWDTKGIAVLQSITGMTAERNDVIELSDFMALM